MIAIAESARITGTKTQIDFNNSSVISRIYTDKKAVFFLEMLIIMSHLECLYITATI